VELPGVVVEIRLTSEPSHAQKAAWATLWRWILGLEGNSPAPAVPAGTGLEGAREPDALMDHDQEVINDPPK
jgi:hypothetical protein